MFLANKLLNFSETISRLAVWFGGIFILAVTMLISVEIVLRKFLGISTGGVDELSGYALAISFSWALSFTLLRRGHVRIDALYSRLPVGPRTYLDCLSIFSLTIFALFLTFFSFQVLLDTIELHARSTTTLETPLWLPQMLWIGGFILFSANCCLLLLLSLLALFAGDFERVRYLVGSRTTSEEIAAENPSSLAQS